MTAFVHSYYSTTEQIDNEFEIIVGGGSAEALPVIHQRVIPSRSEMIALSDQILQNHSVVTDQDELVLMDVDPHRLHCYWNLTNKHHISPILLRVYEANEILYEKVINSKMGNHYFSDVVPGKRYFAELGGWKNDSEYSVISTSNEISMPWSQPVIHEKPVWVNWQAPQTTVDFCRECSSSSIKGISAVEVIRQNRSGNAKHPSTQIEIDLNSNLPSSLSLIK